MNENNKDEKMELFDAIEKLGLFFVDEDGLTISKDIVLEQLDGIENGNE